MWSPSRAGARSIMITRARTAASTRLPAENTISNRHSMRLEIAVTHTKQTPDPFLIDTENAPFRTTPRTWGSQFWLRNEAHPSLQCVSSPSPRTVAQAGVGLCAVASASSSASAVASAFDFPPLTSSRGPFTGRRISLRFLSAPSFTLATEPVATQLIISNRSARRLELPESC